MVSFPGLSRNLVSEAEIVPCKCLANSYVLLLFLPRFEGINFYMNMLWLQIEL